LKTGDHVCGFYWGVQGRDEINIPTKVYEDFVSAATADGGVARVTGEGAWAFEGYPGVQDLMDYEAELNRMIKRHPQMILCLTTSACLAAARWWTCSRPIPES
jgi:hypothetical protein